MAPATMTLSQTAALYSITEASILFYETEGLVLPLRIDGVRYYSPKLRVKIEVVLKGKELGFSLREIKRLIEAHLPTSDGQFLGKTQIKSQIEELEGEKQALQAAIDRLRTRMDEV